MQEVQPITPAQNITIKDFNNNPVPISLDRTNDDALLTVLDLHK